MVMSMKISVPDLIDTLNNLYLKNPSAKLEIEISPNNSYSITSAYFDSKENSIKIH